MIASFLYFKKGILRLFRPTNDKNIAIRAIQTLRQVTLASDYAAKFQEAAQTTKQDNDALIVIYRRGLKDNIKDELIRDRRRNDTLNKLIETIIKIDDRLYERAIERRGGVGF